MAWFEKLDTYFPEEEMKTREQFNALLSESNYYKKEETSKYVVMYAEYEEFIFIDYLWVSPSTRGQGIGRKILEKFKKKNKTILLEVEPIDETDPDTAGRLKFYDKLGFTFAKTFRYIYQASTNDKDTELDIMYYHEGDISEITLYRYMKRVHEEIHTYKEKELYGIQSQKAEEVLQFADGRSN